MAVWNPWRGCHRCSDGCLHCYIHKGDARRGVDTSQIVQTKDFFKPLEKKKNGEPKLKAGIVYLCFSSDFLIEEADPWRPACWQMIKQRPDCLFLFLTKRIRRFLECVPADWGAGYDNVIVGCTVENQRNADVKLPIFQQLPIRHKCIVVQPMIGPVSLESYLEGIDLVVVGGESDRNGRLLDYAWVLDLKDQCIRQNVSFEFRQCSTNFRKDGRLYRIPTRQLSRQARKADINYRAKNLDTAL